MLQLQWAQSPARNPHTKRNPQVRLILNRHVQVSVLGNSRRWLEREREIILKSFLYMEEALLSHLILRKIQRITALSVCQQIGHLLLCFISHGPFVSHPWSQPELLSAHNTSDTNCVGFVLCPTTSSRILQTPTKCPTVQFSSGTDYPSSCRPRRLRAQSHKMPPLQAPVTSPGLPPSLPTNQL